MPKLTPVKLSLRHDQVKPFAMDAAATFDTLSALGVSVSDNAIRQASAVYAMDATPDLVTGASVTNPIQFFQHFLAEPVRVITQARTADKIIGRDFAGKWSDEEVVLTAIENVGQSREYGDKTNDGMLEWNQNFERRTIKRFGLGIEVGILEEERASAMRINSGSEKRMAVTNAFAITINGIAFNGYNSGDNRTYGILNDPNLPTYGTITGVWSGKTFAQITADIRMIMNALRVRSGSNFEPSTDAAVMALPPQAMEALGTTTDLGISVKEWISKTFPGLRIEVAPQFYAANGGENVVYVIAESLMGRKVVNQYVQDVFRMLGVERKAKGYVEAYACSTAGTLFAQPLGVVRYSGC
jgi:hypothetical protein